MKKIELVDMSVEKVTRKKGNWSLKMVAQVNDDQGPIKDAEITLAIANGGPGNPKITDEHGKAHFDITRRTLDDFEVTFEAMGEKLTTLLYPSRHSTARSAPPPTPATAAAPTPTPAKTGEKEIEVTEYLDPQGDFVLSVRVVGKNGEVGKTVITYFFQGDLETKETDDNGCLKLVLSGVEEGQTETVTLTAPNVPEKTTVALERPGNKTSAAPKPGHILATPHSDEHGNFTVAIQVTDICKKGVETDLTIVADGRTQLKRTEPNGWLTVDFGRVLREGEKAKMIIIVDGLVPKEVALSFGQEAPPERLRYQAPEQLPRPKKPLSFWKLLAFMSAIMSLFVWACHDYARNGSLLLMYATLAATIILPLAYWGEAKLKDLAHDVGNDVSAWIGCTINSFRRKKKC